MSSKLDSRALWLIGSLLTAPLWSGCSVAGDSKASAWPQWGGPQRNFTATPAELATSWPDGGPRGLWSRPLGDGYSTIVTDGKRLYVTYRDDDDHEIVAALDPRSGRTLWQHRYPAPFVNEGEGEDDKKHIIEFGVGPQSTPLVVGDRLYTLGFTGMLKCLNTASGKVLWAHDLPNELGASFMRFGHATSPISYGSMIILPVGGQSPGGLHNGMVAFDGRSGAIVWRSMQMQAGYSSPILVNVGGEDLLISYMDEDFVALDPRSGGVRWRLAPDPEQKFRGAIMTPMWCPNDTVFFRVAGNEEGGCAMRFSKSGDTLEAQRAWFNTKIKGALNNPVLIGDAFYGPEGGSADFFMAFDLHSGEVLWKERGYPQAKCLACGDKLVILDEKGVLTLATPSREGLEVHAQATLLEEKAWALPTLTGTTLFLRDNNTIRAVDLGV